jgi:hypothetical protein
MGLNIQSSNILICFMHKENLLSSTIFYAAFSQNKVCYIINHPLVTVRRKLGEYSKYWRTIPEHCVPQDKRRRGSTAVILNLSYRTFCQEFVVPPHWRWSSSCFKKCIVKIMYIIPLHYSLSESSQEFKSVTFLIICSIHKTNVSLIQNSMGNLAFVSGPTCYRSLSPGRHLTPYPMNNTHK